MSGKTYKWTEDRLAALVAALGRSRTLAEGLAAASQDVGFTVTRSAADEALRKSGRPTAWHHVGKRPTIPVEIVDDEIPVYCEEPHPADTEPDTMPGIQSAPMGWAYEAARERILFVPDCHFPYVDRIAWALMLQCARRFKPHRIVVLGDFMDCFTVSSHLKDPRRQSQLDFEIDAAKAARAELDALGAEHKHFVMGNHEHRLYKYLAERAPALLNSVKIDELLELPQNGWSCTQYGQSLRIGDLWVTHAVNGVAGQNAHHRASLRFHRSVIIGHTHQMGFKVFGDAMGNRYHATMLGWLGAEVAADYTHEVEKSASWAHGFGLGYMLPNGRVYVVPVPILDRSAVVHGEVVRLARTAA